jgi:ATP-dependent DNA helicase RecQ
MAYAAGRACRHATLAAHLGERLAPCRTACDVCAPTDPEVAASDRSKLAAAADVPKRSTVTADDARAVLQAVRTLPYPMGKTGLTKLLIGSIESRVRDDRSSSFGALAHLPKARIDELIDRMVKDGLLEKVHQQGASRDFNAIRLASFGDSVTDEMLEAYATPVRSRSSPTSPSGATPAADGLIELGPLDEALYDRLVAWRRQRASEAAMPPYVIAHDRTLREIAAIRPATRAELNHVHGMGQSRIERYGEELLALVSGVEGPTG